MINITDLKYDENGLIPAIVFDAESGSVLMLAYMNAESLKISIDEGRTCFWSRSRQELWRKGETSGNVQLIVSITTDCDKDTLLVTVKKSGPACHTGAESCFFEELYSDSSKQETQMDGSSILSEETKEKFSCFSLDTLHGIIEDRKINRVPGSYTTYLFEKGIDKILKKFGEESTEVIIAAKDANKKETVYELADLVYHAMVLMTKMNITPEDIRKELASRHVES